MKRSKKKSKRDFIFSREERVVGAALAMTIDGTHERQWVWNMAAAEFVQHLRKFNKEIKS